MGSVPAVRTTRRNFLVGGALAAGGVVAGTVGQEASSPSAGASQPGTSTTGRGKAHQATSPFNAPVFDGQGLFALGAAAVNTSEVGEVLTAFDAINAESGNPTNPGTAAFDAYVEEFLAAGNRLASLAQASSAARQSVSAKYQYLRASNYFTQALFFVLGTSHPSEEAHYFDLVNQSWQAALAAWSPAPVQFTVHAGSYSIPVYFFRPDDSGTPRPTLIISEGSDGQNVETMQFGVPAGLERGYNVALFEGPGQMSLLFQQQIPFTPNWNEIVGPIVQALAARPDVQADRIGLIGVSFAGMLCARAAAQVPGLAAVVLEPAAVSMATLWGDPKDLAAVKELQGAPAAVQAKYRKEINAGFNRAWPHLSRVDQFEIMKRGEIFTTQVQDDARAGKPPSDYYALLQAILPFDYTADYQAITIPTLLTQNQGDTSFGSQPQLAYSLLTKVPAADKKLVRFTAAEGAQLHDQPMAPQFAQETIFSWLAPYLQG